MGAIILHKFTLFVFVILLRNFLADEDVLVSYVNKDASWQWVTMYRLGSGSGWQRDSSSGSYTTCDLISTKINSTNSWLVSDFITLNNAKTVTLSLTFTARKCDLGNFPFCKQSIGIYSNENDVSKVGGVGMETILAGNFTFVGNMTAENVWSSGESPQDNLMNITFGVKSKGVYVAFRDTGACVAVTAVRMTSLYCPNMVSGGAVFNRTGVTLPGHVNKVKGECLAMSENLANATKLFLRCLRNGSWSNDLQVACQCKSGYQPGQSTCQGCPPGLYKPSTGNTMCIPCPENTHTSVARNECICNQGFYRSAMDEQDGKCTGPPSGARDLTSMLIGQDVILLSWKRPLHDGGRNDVIYSISCFRCNHSNIHINVSCSFLCGSSIKYNPSSNGLSLTHVIISGLVPGSLYSFKVLSKNGVSDLVRNTSFDLPEVRTVIPLPDPPKILTSFLGEDAAVLSLSEVKQLSSFAYSLSCHICEASDCVACQTSCGNTIKYSPEKNFTYKTYTVVSSLTHHTHYQFTLEVTERESGKLKRVSATCLSTKRKSTASPTTKASTRKEDMITLYSKVAFGLSVGFLVCSIILLVVSVCLRRKWFNSALSMTAVEGRTNTICNGERLQNNIKTQENILYMEERVLNNNK